MTIRPANRLLRSIGWLLTPFVVWAASFLGGWLGAIMGRRLGTLGGGIGWLLMFNVLAGAAALVGWVWYLRRHAPTQPAPPDQAAATGRPGEND